ncbi:DNA-binding response regulator, OmpR family, contains REC and winged-helix (wHTH) domain [Lutimaribacter pacificus]|uniref:DNA-binding response regulator, OmpR family, contains REC and winged-helix (WHTH) domain n=1 Tax=Lutimaribacter pacificus TaxID=391948 RepID=A0A1H0HQR0_9RHOB|nr:response regulator [Lutimaribacter pacificus]SDO21151.1 DNA-binding response regulator, OmpR family, contains REC and winged-helix (wHTH) domain [Lutimaribacter pacificus]SHK32878.1 DNA-binding response regulator, OmpR family, contains REC and winged-helix (wHTH) domain [Lutimaribacter pacificus]
MKILVVDDNESIVNLLSDILSKTGFHTVVTALGSREAMDLIRSAEPAFDCFVVDIQMPDIDGIELTRFIRSDPRHQTAPVVILTAMHQKAYLDRAFAAGATDYATKPFNFVELRKLIQSARKVAMDPARQAQPQLAAAQETADVRPVARRFDEPVPLPHIDSALGKLEFENYAMQLSRRRFSRSAVFAIELRGAQSLFRQLPEEEFARLIGMTARAIERGCLQSGGALSYRGGGVFLVVRPFRLINPFFSCEQRVNTEFDKLHGEDAPVDMPNLIVGQPVVLGMMSRTDALAGLTRAIANVTENPATREASNVSQRAFLRSASMPEKQRLEQLSYETLLRETMPEESNDGWSRILLRKSRETYGTGQRDIRPATAKTTG